MSKVTQSAMGWYACISGRADGSVPQELTLHDDESRTLKHVHAPEGHYWRDVVAAGDDMFIAAATAAGAQAPLHLLAISAGSSGWAEPALRPLPVPPILGAHPYDVAITARDTHALIIADLGQTESREHLFLVPTVDAAPTRIWPLPPGGVHVSSIATAPGDQVVLTVTGVHPQYRQILRCRMTDEPLLADHTVLVQDRDQGIHQIWTADLSPDGNLLAVAHTSHDGAVFTVSVTDLGQNSTRVAWQRPCSSDDPALVHLSFSRSGRHLLFSYGDLIGIDLAHHTHRLLSSPGEGRWLLAAG